MANQEHADWLLTGKPWEALLKANLYDVHLDLSGFDLAGKNLQGAPLRGADLSGAKLAACNLTGSSLIGANLKGANLEAANLEQANLVGADLTNANLTNASLANADLTNAILDRANLAEASFHGAILERAKLSDAFCPGAKFVNAKLSGSNLRQAYLAWADLSEATLIDADLTYATLVGASLDGADLTGAHIYGISAWDVKVNEKTRQLHLIVTSPSPRHTVITVDNLEVAQFIYMLLSNEKIRHVIDTITSKVVLILGRFTPERKMILDAIRDNLRRHDFVPVLFDFDQPSSRTTLETITTLAHMGRFVIADITDAKSVLQELQAIVPDNPSVPVQPLLLNSQEEPGMFDFFRRYPWVLETCRYDSLDELLELLDQEIIVTAESKARELAASSK